MPTLCVFLSVPYALLCFCRAACSQGLGSLSRDRTWAASGRARSPNPWPAREVPSVFLSVKRRFVVITENSGEVTRRQVGTQPKERPCGPLHTAELPVGLVRGLGFRHSWSWGQPWADVCPWVQRGVLRAHMLLVKDQRSRGGQPTQGPPVAPPLGV